MSFLSYGFQTWTKITVLDVVEDMCVQFLESCGESRGEGNPAMTPRPVRL